MKFNCSIDLNDNNDIYALQSKYNSIKFFVGKKVCQRFYNIHITQLPFAGNGRDLDPDPVSSLRSNSDLQRT